MGRKRKRKRKHTTVRKPWWRPSPKYPCGNCGMVVLGRPHLVLCRPCYLTPRIRAEHYQERRIAKERSQINRVPPLPAEPTSALPGSAEKVEVMRLRVESGVQLWHPEDVVRSLR